MYYIYLLHMRMATVCAFAVEDMCHRYPNAIQVNICGTPALHSLVMKAVSALRYLIFYLFSTSKCLV